MSANPDAVYYREREQHQRAMAQDAASYAARSLHEELAERYHGLAIAAEFNRPRRDQGSA